MTMTWSPMSIKGVHCGLRLPVSTLATSVASRPTVCTAASTTYHLRFSASPVPLGKCVDIDNSLYFKRLERERVEYRNGPKNVKLNRAHTGDPVGFAAFARRPTCVEARQS